jgi:hypothetical protein
MSAPAKFPGGRRAGAMEHMVTARAMQRRVTIASLGAVPGCASWLCNLSVIPDPMLRIAPE